MEEVENESERMKKRKRDRMKEIDPIYIFEQNNREIKIK